MSRKYVVRCPNCGEESCDSKIYREITLEDEGLKTAIDCVVFSGLIALLAALFAQGIEDVVSLIVFSAICIVTALFYVSHVREQLPEYLLLKDLRRSQNEEVDSSDISQKLSREEPPFGEEDTHPATTISVPDEPDWRQIKKNVATSFHIDPEEDH